MSCVGYLPAQNCRTTAIHSNNVALLPIHLKCVAQELLPRTDYDEHVDSWALGVMMAELLAGKHPFHGRSDTEHLSEILDLLGTADIKEWSGYDGRRLPGGCQPGSFLRNKFPCQVEARMKGPPTLLEAGFEVLSGLLRCNPEKRLTAEQALKHRWFKEANPRATRS
ncbi:putative cyclin-dependent kinase F-2 [Aegilops tauschii subsp. strangulata]|uniref:[RNA-polymerase]-subunit kinase n=1 Tax=Aegilops tauschii TaxID=37682 RepID=N1QR75_AEGTA|nr:putative cyclin-dependent kinase F-2 [Aegilops tauschii subsp. strangulata]